MPNLDQFNSKEEYNAWFRNYREKNADKLRKYQREFNKAWRKENGFDAEYRAKKKFPEKQSARRKLQKAVKRGKIKKLPCIICGSKNSQGHHEDYTKPLEVIWLCPLHHMQKHKKTSCA